MTLWVILTILTSMASVLVAAPLLRKFDDAQAKNITGLEVYKDQLAEIEKELEQDLIDKAEADLARIEIERRILNMRKTGNTQTDGISPYWQQKAVIAIAALVIAGSVGLYALNARPDLPSAAFMQQAKAKQQTQPSGQQTKPEQVKIMVQRLEAKLKANPEYADGWRVLGWSYYNSGRYQDAVAAYKRAVALKQDNPILKSLQGEAMVKVAKGKVTNEALEVFKSALVKKPNDVRARYFSGLHKEQNNDPKAAVNDYIALLKLAPAKAQWAGDLRVRIRQLAQKTGVQVTEAQLGLKQSDEAKRKQQTAAVQAVKSIHGKKGPSAQDIKASNKMKPQDRYAMIRSMVSGLDARLKKSPKDANGWIMLIRSRMVLKEPDAARAALAEAQKVFADEPKTLEHVKQVAKSFGVITQ